MYPYWRTECSSHNKLPEVRETKVKPIKVSVFSNKAQIIHNDKQSINIGTKELQQSYDIYVPVANAGK